MTRAPRSNRIDPWAEMLADLEAVGPMLREMERAREEGCDARADDNSPLAVKVAQAILANPRGFCNWAKTVTGIRLP